MPALEALRRLYWHGLQRCESIWQNVDLNWLRLRNRISRRSVVDSAGPVVCLTSYGQRVDSVYLTLESIARGQLLPSRLILWIDESAVLENPPRTLKRLRRRGVEILACPNYGPHKKYYPYVEGQSEFKRGLVTADDDVVYPKHWLRELVEYHNVDPESVICFRAREVTFAGRTLAEYSSWSLCGSARPSARHIAIGVSGVLYPIGLQRHLKAAGRGFLDCCPRADDLWLHVNAVRCGYKIRQLHDKPLEFPSLPGSQAQALFKANALDGQNDVQIQATYLARDIEVLLRGG